MVLGVPIPDFQVITRRILIIVMAIKLLMYERNAFFDKKISSYKPFNVNQDSQSIEDEQMHLLNGSIHEDINQVFFQPHRKRHQISLQSQFFTFTSMQCLFQEARERRRSNLKELPPIQSRSLLVIWMRSGLRRYLEYCCDSY